MVPPAIEKMSRMMHYRRMRRKVLRRCQRCIRLMGRHMDCILKGRCRLGRMSHCLGEKRNHRVVCCPQCY